MRRLWARLWGANPLVVDSIFAALVMVAGLVTLGNEPTPANPTPTDALAVVLVVVGFGAIALRRRFPLSVLAVVTAATLVYVVRDYPDNGLPVMGLISLYTLASLRERRVWVAAVSVFLGLLVISAVTHPDELGPLNSIGNVAIFGIAAVYGDSVRVRRATPPPSRLGPPTSSATSRPRPAGGGRGTAAHRPGAARRGRPHHERGRGAVGRGRPRDRLRPGRGQAHPGEHQGDQPGGAG